MAWPPACTCRTSDGYAATWLPISKNVAVEFVSFKILNTVGVYGPGPSSKVRYTTPLEPALTRFFGMTTVGVFAGPGFVEVDLPGAAGDVEVFPALGLALDPADVDPADVKPVVGAAVGRADAFLCGPCAGE